MLNGLLNNIGRISFRDIGKPEPLKHNLTGYRSCRITDEHRLIYKVEDERIVILSCRYHYYWGSTSYFSSEFLGVNKIRIIRQLN
ncbi:Txe/YoeB family addiction module toxin [Photorhabdus luminescens subsp. sonorensis]|uniref:Putative mRNA interferase YoeB n=1 Tax=Photorhabdus luminescens subsp. sonorensis TaxID=1173677 RepID=A0A5C4RFW9_PHOLU|nr:Txe/YoeB family addiction module toxin [Photorhabdus luminescens subsp. sonorensis]